GGINAKEFSLTELGEDATGADEVARAAAYKKAVMNVEPFNVFFQAFSNKKVPGPTPFKEFLINSAGVAPERAEECMKFILADAETAGLVRSMKGGAQYVDLTGTPAPMPTEEEEVEGDDESSGRLENELGIHAVPGSGALRQLIEKA